MPLTTQAEDEALSLFTELLKADSTNPPGNERACAEILAEALRADGYEPQLLEKAPGRTSLVVRRRGDGSGGGPLLLTGHLDVAPADASAWKHPPFGAAVEDGWLYGRGSADMKGHLAACATILRQLARDGARLKRDVIFAAVADGEHGGSLGARFLVDEHPDLVRAEWAIGEGGGTTIEMEGRRLYPILVAHKGLARISMKASRPEGQGSLPLPDSAPLKLARALARIGNMALPVHVTEPARRMLRALGAAGCVGGRLTTGMLSRRPLADFALESMVSEPRLRLALSAVLRNTATPAELSAAGLPGTVPATAEAILDGRLLPGQGASALLAELREVIDDADLTLTVLEERPAVDSPIGSPLYERLAAAVKEIDPRGIPVPFLSPGSTDASAFCRLGMRFYGFAPVRLPEGSSAPFGEPGHGADERIPIEGWKAGLRVLHGAVVDFCST